MTLHDNLTSLYAAMRRKGTARGTAAPRARAPEILHEHMHTDAESPTRRLGAASPRARMSSGAQTRVPSCSWRTRHPRHHREPVRARDESAASTTRRKPDLHNRPGCPEPLNPNGGIAKIILTGEIHSYRHGCPFALVLRRTKDGLGMTGDRVRRRIRCCD